MKKNKKSFTYLLIAFLLLLIVYPNVSLNGAKEGINLWLFIVVPSLFPFFVINDILMAINVPENIAMLFTPIVKKFFNASGYGAYAFIMSIFSGYPSGAKIVRDLIKGNKISPKEGQRILTFSSTSGPLFIIGAVGYGMLKSNIAGYVLYVSHILGAVLNGILFRFIIKKENKNNIYSNPCTLKDYSPFEIFAISIKDSLITCGLIGGYIIFFSVIIYLLREIQYFKIIEIFLKKYLHISNFYALTISNLLEASLEISNGSKIISALNNSFIYKLYLLSFIIAFSGISIIGQVSGIINKTGINIKLYILSKISHGAFSCLSCCLLVNLFKINFSVFNNTIYSIELSEIFLIEIFLMIIWIFIALNQIKKVLIK
ncbi:hypothetical protein FDN13_00145 [Caloramator sp. E03]|nr:hypothetical protein FDN13_00145 [Caloramator sp. E03]